MSVSRRTRTCTSTRKTIKISFISKFKKDEVCDNEPTNDELRRTLASVIQPKSENKTAVDDQQSSEYHQILSKIDTKKSFKWT